MPVWVSPSLIAALATTVLFSSYAVFMLFPFFHVALKHMAIISTATEFHFKHYEYMEVPAPLYAYAAGHAQSPRLIAAHVASFSAAATFAYLVLKAAVSNTLPAATHCVSTHCDALLFPSLTVYCGSQVRLRAQDAPDRSALVEIVDHCKKAALSNCISCLLELQSDLPGCL